MTFKKILKAFVPAVVVVGVAGAAASWMMKNRIEVETVEAPEDVRRAEFIVARKGSHQVTLVSSGEVLPHTKSTLIPQVLGEVIRVSPAFRNGGFFEAGEVLIELDEADYRAAETEAEATLAQSTAALALEVARAKQAVTAWHDLGRGGEPSDLTMRKPQLAEARAASEAAAARLARAQRDLERTKIAAPYPGYVRDKSVDLGQVVSPGTPIAEIFAIDYVEVRLPIDPGDLEFLDLPQRYRRGVTVGEKQPKVLLRDSNIPSLPWVGRLVRAEGEFDARSRKLFVIAQVDDPYALNDKKRPPLKVGQFVSAEIEGKTLEGVFVIPEQAVRFGNQIKIIDQENRIRLREVTVIFDTLPNLIVSEGLEEGERICLTALPFAIDGSLVEPRERITPEESE
ncbi:MAG: efflux RND transporter periplasmic adaptor subunit [Verrucomicrobiales bacterium]|jgi:multidrug efflux system membrane fusion protein